MIRKLQWRIISINMILMGIVIAAVCTALCVNAYTHAVEELEHGLNQVVERDGKGKFIPESTETGDSPFPFDKSQKERFEGKPDIHENAPMEISSYVTVELDANGNILNTTEHNVTIDEEDLQAIAQIVSKNGTRSGQLSDYGLMYVTKRTMSGSLLGLASTSSLNDTLRNSVLMAVGMFFGSMVVVFLISLGLSRLAVNPVKRAWDQQKQFIADASHELKTPLTVILANNNIVMSHPDAAVRDEQKWLESTEEEAQHMKSLIDQMLFLAKADAGGVQAEKSEVNFSELVEGASLNFEPVAFEKEVLIDTDIAEDVLLMGNPTQLNQLTHILIDNAVKYAEPSSTVTIILKKKNDTAEFVVNNHGTPISKEDLPHIFDRFYRAEKSRTTKGYGLGLSIAQNIVQNMNGRLTVQSDAENGTTFTATFKLNT